MSDQGELAGEAVVVTTDVEASPETVFAFVSDPQRMMQWLGAAVEMDARIGGSLRIRFDRFGTLVQGEVVEIAPPRRVVFTWGVAEGPQAASLPPGSTRVVIELEPIASGTRVTLRHEGLPDEKERREHEGGWRYYAGQLALLSVRVARGPRIEAAVDAFVAAWNERDAAARAALLERSFSEDGRFEDEHAVIDGRVALDAHVAAVQSMFPLTLVREGAAQVMRDAVRFRWRIAGPDGTGIARGENVGDLDATCRLRRVLGFADPA